MKVRNKKTLQGALFSEGSLVILISLVTLLLQLISFATTWNGAKIYLEGVFPYASLLFAIAIQATAYFFSNSLRTKIRPLKVLALCMALCCSTYYSYIGIYNSVNSPASYLQQSYSCIQEELTRLFEEELTKNIADARQTVSAAASCITQTAASLSTEAQNIASCRAALEEIQTSYTSEMRAPKLSSYENYEEYAAAYQAYINSVSLGSSTETDAARSSTLLSYGYTSMEDLNAKEQLNSAQMKSLNTALGISDDSSAVLLERISDISPKLSTAIGNAALGQSLSPKDASVLNQLFQAAALCGYQGTQLSSVINTLNQCAQVSAAPLMSEYTALTSALPKGHVTSANTMELKSSMDSEILSALIKVNSLLPTGKQLAFDNSRYRLTDLYLIPVEALKALDTRMTALFCLFVAALIDGLSLVFAISLRAKKPLWKRHRLPLVGLEEYAPLIYAALPANVSPAQALAEFMSCFQPSPQTEADGYMMQTDIKLLEGYGALMALLCQTNLAKLVPAGFLENESELLLLRARFVFWADTIIYEERSAHTKAETYDSPDTAQEVLV